LKLRTSQRLKILSQVLSICKAWHKMIANYFPLSVKIL
jgi:hypothetical protein